ncbi:NAD(P)-dependent oxidoreductase [Streptomyces cinnamoneus]|uniref:NAD(P)-dependent oxidoreductase n=1 Tax=Streptomyces cinnamoneus TaxID=53446 RepID=A0A2G1XIW0_STRCJ|nr:NAD(P)H-binding protein [Streptomyces cinnamoneus]PHQ51188.1 NAD(P)-dependent oxidoreductase [Streptomyces cinnamoneus]PPT13588.1 NAD(P)-dependent oxidoreductase [Streptomyces cinnamoneus]
MTTDAKDILVLGGTGKTGRRLVRVLRAAGETVRAASRSGEVRFDWNEPETWRPALAGASAVYLVAPDDPAPVADFVALAVASGVGRFVALSGRGIEQVGPGFGEGMAAAEQAVRASGAAWTILRPNNFHQNFDEDLWHGPLRDGRLALPIGEVPEPFVDADDVAEVAAAVLTGDDHDGQVYELSGPRALTFAQAVEVIARAAGRPMRYEEISAEAYAAQLRAAGTPESFVVALGALFAMHREGHSAELADGVRRVLGREPRDLADYAARAAAAGAWD